MGSSNYILFDDALLVNGEEIEGHNVADVVDLNSTQGAVVVGENSAIECTLERPVLDEEIKILEIAFTGGKQRKTTFNVDVVSAGGEKKEIGVYESSGSRSGFEKFVFPAPVSDIKSVILTFRGNDDRSPHLMVRGIRMCRELTEADRRRMSIKIV